MLKLVVIFAAVAFCQALQGGYEHEYHVKVVDKNIIIRNEVGQRVHIFTDHKHVEGTGHFLQIHVTGPGVVLKSEKYIQEPATFEGPYQPDILYHIFTKYDGPLDAVSYEKLLNEIHQHVQDGTVHPAVLYALRILAGQHQDLELVVPGHQHIYKIVEKLFDQGNSEHQYNKLGYHYGQEHYQHDMSDMRAGGKWYGVGNDWKYQSQVHHYPSQYGVHDWSSEHHYPTWEHKDLESHHVLPETHGLTYQSTGSHYPIWKHQELESHHVVPETHGWTHQPSGSHYPIWKHQELESHHVVPETHVWTHQSTGTHYPTWKHEELESHHVVPETHGWTHQSYGSHYPVQYGHQDWMQQNVYPRGHDLRQQSPLEEHDWMQRPYYRLHTDDAYQHSDEHDLGQHHWAQEGLWSHRQYPLQQHKMLVE